MKSPTTRFATAAGIVLAVLTGLYLVGDPFGATVTFAKAIQPILNARAVVLDLIVGDEETSPVIHEIVVGSRIRRTISNLENMTLIIDLESARMLALDERQNTAAYVDIKGPLQERTQNYVAFLRNVITGLQDDPHIEELGEQDIDGQKAIGFVARGPQEQVTIWADPKTAVPIRIELQVGQFSAVFKSFRFDVPVEDSLISMDVPPGYTLQETSLDLSGATEENFIESLRIWAEVLLEGSFPDAVGTESAMKQVPLLGAKLGQLALSDDERTQRAMEFARGMLFFQILEVEGEWHYAGKGVKLGDAGKVILWYRPKGSETYRVVYGDLRVQDVLPEDLPK